MFVLQQSKLECAKIDSQSTYVDSSLSRLSGFHKQTGAETYGTSFDLKNA
jgi:hypothetical protein